MASNLAISPYTVQFMQAIPEKGYYNWNLSIHDVGPIAQTLRMASALW